MLEVTESAKKELAAYFDGKEKNPIRIFLAPGGCGGPHLGLALDEVRDLDASQEVDGLTFCMNQALLDQVKSVKVDLTWTGFVVEPEVPLPQVEGGGCGGCCGSCGGH